MHILSLLFDLSIHNSVNSWPYHFKFSTVVVEKGTSGCIGITLWYFSIDISPLFTVGLSSNLHKQNQIDDLHLYFNMTCDTINLVFNKMEETFQSNTLDWSSLVFYYSFLFFSTATCVLRFLHYFSTNLDEIWHVDSPWWDEQTEYFFKSIGPGVGIRRGPKVLLCFIIGKTLYTVRRDKNFT